MENFICINGRKTILTSEQVKELGFPPITGIGDMLPEEIQKIVRANKHLSCFHLHDKVVVGNRVFEIVDMKPRTNQMGNLEPSIILMSIDIVAERRLNDGACKRGWVDTEMRVWMNETFIKKIPTDWLKVMQPTTNITHDGDGNEHKSVDNLWLPSESELFGSAIYAKCEDGMRYDAFATSDDRIRRDKDGDKVWFWTRSAIAGSSASFVLVNSYGAVGNNYASNAAGASVCFRIA